MGLFAVFVVISFYPLLLFFAGWTSGNKFASISAQRSIVMMVSYEIPLFLVMVAVSMLAGASASSGSSARRAAAGSR